MRLIAVAAEDDFLETFELVFSSSFVVFSA